MMQQRQVLMAGLFGFMAVGLCLLAASQVQAASSNGPYYAEPSWSQKLPAATRFVVLLDWNSEAVLDRNTGLVWEKSPQAVTATWNGARFGCLRKTVGGQKGWRLPSIPELASLGDPSVASPGPTLPPGHPFTNVLSSTYWSATTDAASATFAWYVDFNNGFVNAFNKSDSLQVWCVRGGMNADAY
jgi:hypothetical protein